jgi:L-alanine-DL-glutamate epimerase-like enolase superfamily enzyme
MHTTKPAELADGWTRAAVAFVDPPAPRAGRFTLPTGPGLGLELDAEQVRTRRLPVG